LQVLIGDLLSVVSPAFDWGCWGLPLKKRFAGEKKMIKSRRGVGAKSSNHRSTVALELLLNETVCFLLRAGLPRQHLLKLLQQNSARIRSRDRKPHGQVERVRGWYQDTREVAANVVADWHRESQYSDASGEPRPLSEVAVKELISARCGAQNCLKTLASLCTNGIIHRNEQGLYTLGTSVRAALFSARELVLLRAAVVVPEILTAALKNSRVALSANRELNRTVRVRHLPKKYLPLWHQLIRERTQAFLEGLDNWLEDHNKPDSLEPTVSVGLHVCACAARTAKAGFDRENAETGFSSRTERSRVAHAPQGS
jgi:hypothetical protein